MTKLCLRVKTDQSVLYVIYTSWQTGRTK